MDRRSGLSYFRETTDFVVEVVNVRGLLMASQMRVAAFAIGTSLLLAGCSSSEPELEPTLTTSQPAPESLPTGPLTAGQIAKALSERTFAFSAPGRSGTITYYSDGTFSYEEANKGPGTGIWQASDGRLCEAYNPTSFLPRGTPSTCQPLASDGVTFTAGNMQLRPV